MEKRKIVITVDKKKHLMKEVEGWENNIREVWENHIREVCIVNEIGEVRKIFAKDLGILNEDGLLPCPFCREYPKIGNFGDGFSDTTFYVKHNQSECVICGPMRTKSFKTRQQAIDAWNRRV